MQPKLSLKLILALFCIAFFWGTTYLGIRIGVETIPPMLVTSLRNLLAGSILLIYLLFSGKLESVDRKRFQRNFVISFALIVLGNGLTTYAEKYISSGLAALIATLSPLCVLLLNLGLGYEKPSLKISAGIGLGLLGMYFIYRSSLADLFNPEYRLGIAAMLTAVLMWSTGTIYSKRSSAQPGNIMVNLCIQMLFAGIILLAAQLLIQPDFGVATWSTRSILAVLYLAIFGSVVGYVCYMYALSKMPSTKVSVITYINVVVALSLGWLLLNEKVTLQIVLAAALIISGVLVANYTRKQVATPAEV